MKPSEIYEGENSSLHKTEESMEEIESKINHTTKLVPQSQRELFISEVHHIIDMAVAKERHRIVERIDRLARIIIEGEAEEMSDAYIAKLATINDIRVIVVDN